MSQTARSASEQQTASQTTAPSLDDVSREVRFATVMYGGVSLAIYINGVAQELYAMVRATSACGRDVNGRLSGQAKRASELAPVERVYRKLAYLLADSRLLGRQRDWLAAGRPADRPEPAGEAADRNAPLGLRFVVDIISGTSAGGINGVFLAKALANDQDMELLKRLWLQEGDIGLLLNDTGSLADLPPSLALRGLGKPASLLNSQRMYYKLLQALTEMDRGRAAAAQSPHIDELDLYITATDIDGALVPLRLADNIAYERRHRNVFHLRYAAPDTAGPQNDFTLDANPFLAFAARCTSSFPFAFEPMRLTDIESVAGTLPEYRNRPEATAGHAAWRKHFGQTRDAVSGVETDDYKKRAYGDGGYLDNKPFSYATGALSRRQVDVPVSRKLIYIEPAPEHPEDESDRNAVDGWPDALDNVLASLIGIPRYETIREDLERVLARNRRISRVRRITDMIEKDIDFAVARRTKDDSPQARPEEWDGKDLQEMIDQYGIYYLPYRRLRIGAVTDDLVAVLERVGRFTGDSDHTFALQCLVRAWRNATYCDNPKAEGDSFRAPTNAFLTAFDVSYRVRRLQLLLGKADQLSSLLRRLRADDPELRFHPNIHGHDRDIGVIREIDKLLGAPGTLLSWSKPKLLEMEAVIRVFKRALNLLYRRLRVVVRSLYRRTEGSPLALAIDSLGLDKRHIAYLFGVPWPEMAGGPPAPAGTLAGFVDAVQDGERMLEGSSSPRRSVATDGSLVALENDGLVRAQRLLGSPADYGLPADFAARLAGVFDLLRADIARTVRRRVSDCSARLLGARYAEPEQRRRNAEVPNAPWGLRLLRRRVKTSQLDAVEITAVQNFLRRYHTHFEDYDQISFPILYDTDTTANELVDIIRISPEDARNLVDERKGSDGRRKLAGTALSNFGAFLDRTWRQNDLMWGRLDGAERLIAALLPDSQHWLVRAALIDEAQQAIAVEEMGVAGHREMTALLSTGLANAIAAAGTNSPVKQAVEEAMATLGAVGPINKRLEAILRGCLSNEALLAHLKTDYEVNRQLEPKTTLRVASRATHVTGRVLEAIALRRGSSGRPFAGVAQLGQILVGMVELAVPGSMLNLLAVHWLSVLYVFEAFIIVGATLLAAEGALRFGWAVFGLTLGVHIILLLLNGLMRRWARTVRAFASLVVLSVLSFAAVGVDHVFKLGLVAQAKATLGTLWKGIGSMFA